MEPDQPPGVPGQSPETPPPQPANPSKPPVESGKKIPWDKIGEFLKAPETPKDQMPSIVGSSVSPEVSNPPPSVDPIDGMSNSFQGGNKEEFMRHLSTWSKQNPGMPVEWMEMSLIMGIGGGPEKTAQLSQWIQEAKRQEALGGKEGMQVYDQLREACRTGNQETYDNIRKNSDPNVRKAVSMLGKDMPLNGDTNSFANLTTWDSPHKVREALASLQKPNQPKI